MFRVFGATVAARACMCNICKTHMYICLPCDIESAENPLAYSATSEWYLVAQTLVASAAKLSAQTSILNALHGKLSRVCIGGETPLCVLICVAFVSA